MSKQATQDDDLIILSDSVTNEDEFNFDIESTKVEDSNELIDFTISDETDSKVEEVESKVETQEKEEDFSIDFSFWSQDWENSTEENVEDTLVVEENNQEDDLGFNFIWDDMTDFENNVEEKVQEEILENTESQDLELGFDLTNQSTQELETPVVLATSENTNQDNIADPKDNFSRNDILDDTISRLNQRKEVLNIIRDSKKTKLEDLNTQIKLLKEQVKNVEKEVWELNEEEEGIISDINTINDMKELKAKKTKKSK